MSWKSPIEVVYNDVKSNFEDGVFKAIQRVQINVDKDELIKALQYDRDQYEKGYEDGKRYAEDKIIRCKDCKKRHVCFIGLFCGGDGEEDGYCKWAERKEP